MDVPGLANQYGRAYISYADTGCSLKNLPRVTENKDRW